MNQHMPNLAPPSMGNMHNDGLSTVGQIVQRADLHLLPILFAFLVCVTMGKFQEQGTGRLQI